MCYNVNTKFAPKPQLFMNMKHYASVIMYQGFIQEGGGAEPKIPPPLPEILKLSMVIIVVPSILAI